MNGKKIIEGLDEVDDLIAALESAEVGSRELDVDIARFLGWVYEKREGDGKSYWYEPDAKPYQRSSNRRASQFPDMNWTTSIDDALTLVPDNCGVEIATSPHLRHASAKVSRRRIWTDSDGRRCTSFDIFECPFAKKGVAQKHTPALALCIAALKARKGKPED